MWFWPRMQKVAQIPGARINELRHTFASSEGDDPRAFAALNGSGIG